MQTHSESFLTVCGRNSFVLSSLDVVAANGESPPPPTAKSFPKTASMCPGITTMKQVSSVATKSLTPADGKNCSLDINTHVHTERDVVSRTEKHWKDASTILCDDNAFHL